MLTVVTPKYLGCIEYLADKLFVSSFFLNKIRDFPFPYIHAICTNTALICLALAYTLQIFCSGFYQNQQPGHYGDRTLLLSVLGSLTAWTCIMFPQFWLVCTWLFCLNNLLWIYNEYSRINNPSIYPQMPQNQVAYCFYVTCMTTAGFISALSNTFGLACVGLIGNWLFTGLGLFSLWQSSQPLPQSIPFTA